MAQSQTMPVELLPAVERAAHQLRQELRRRWHPGDRLPPIKELAQMLGTGQTNTHRAARLLAEEGLLVASSKRGTFVQRLPEQTAPTANHTHVRKALILRVPFESSDTFLKPASTALIDRLKEHGVETETELVNIRCELKDPGLINRFDALISFQPSGNLLMANDPNRPGVVLTTSEEEPMAIGAGYDMVSVDSEQGAMLAGDWMRKIAHNSVAFIGAAEDRARTIMDRISSKRLKGFERGYGKPIPPRHRLLGGGYRSALGEEVFETYYRLPRRPTGVFCASDDIAIGFVRAAARECLLPGRDYHVIGFDGQVRGHNLPGGPLTTVRVPAEELGTVAADLLVSRFAQPALPIRRVLLGCDFITGNTAIPANN